MAELKSSTTPTEAVRRYVEVVYANPSNAALMRRFGPERYVDEDLVPRGIITTIEERAAILELHQERMAELESNARAAMSYRP